MIERIVTVCTGNICRSPVAEAVFRIKLPEVMVSSAGLHALVGRDVDPDAKKAAVDFKIPIEKHVARRFTTEIGRDADLILVMDRGQLNEMRARFPEFTGKCFLMRHHCEMQDIPDPYRLGLANHFRAIELIKEGVSSWIEQIRELRDKTEC
jgi:protein-tyrosine phosphatase